MNINILSDETLQEIREVIDSCENAVIIPHKSPDGDAMGSIMALANYLNTKGKNATVVVPDAFPDFLNWLPNVQAVVRYDKHKEKVEQLVAEADTLFFLDFNDYSRTQDMCEMLKSAKCKKVLIDHHLNPMVEDAAVVASFPELSSTCELVFRIIWQLGEWETTDRKFAEQIYCGMMTDTGGFTFNSTRPEIFYIICQLLTRNIDKDKLYRNVYNNYSTWAVRLRGYIMAQKLNVFADLHASYFCISKMELEDYHYIKGDAEGLVNIPLTIKGMKLSISLREDDRQENVVWVSLRSVDDFPCNELAAEFFNGGGHKNASGGRLDCSLAEAEEITRKAIKAWADRLA